MTNVRRVNFAEQRELPKPSIRGGGASLTAPKVPAPKVTKLSEYTIRKIEASVRTSGAGDSQGSK